MEQKNKKKLVCCSENDYFSLFCLEISLRKIIFVKDICKTLILRQLKIGQESIGEPFPVKCLFLFHDIGFRTYWQS